MLSQALAGEGYEVVASATGEDAEDRLGERAFSLVLTDLKLPGMSGIEVLEAAQRLRPGIPVIVMTAFGTVPTAVRAMKLGAIDFVEKPVELDALFSLVAKAVEAEPELDAFEVPGGPTIVGRHASMRAAFRLLRRVSATESTVLLTGESGTGKELFAQAVHALSPRCGRPFVAVNCAAIPAELMENELFGHERGAFTGAHRRQAGRFELAGSGTLLLDEIGELSPAVQGKVLRVLEEKTFERVGSGESHRADVRIVAATNRKLEEMVSTGEFRSDLFYRLDVFPIDLPPLRERRSDIPLLTRYLLPQIGDRLGCRPPRPTREAEALLEQQEWQGNVRQLANLLERSVILSDSATLGVADVRALLGPWAADDERERVRRALESTDGDKDSAAQQLGISRRTLQRRIQSFDLEGFPRYR